MMSQTDLDRTLVGLVKQTTAIWDRSSNTYPNKQLKMQMWKNIAEKLNLETNSCILRWKALREKYIRQKIKFQNEGQKWELLDDMLFLDKVIHYRSKTGDDSKKLFYPTNRQEFKTYESDNSTPSQIQYSCEEDSYCNDSSNDLIINIKNEENCDETYNSVPDSSSRKHKCSSNSDEIQEKRQKLEDKEEKSPEELFGNLVAAFLKRKPEKDRNTCMIQIMSVLTK